MFINHLGSPYLGWSWVEWGGFGLAPLQNGYNLGCLSGLQVDPANPTEHPPPSSPHLLKARNPRCGLTLRKGDLYSIASILPNQGARYARRESP